MTDEYIRLDTTIIAIDNLINEAATGTMARTLFKAKDTIYSQQRYFTDVQPVKWISVKDKLPEEADADVLVWIEHGTADGVEFYDSLHIAHWYGDDKVFADLKDDEIKGVTHWMYRSAILEPPKEGDTE